MKTIVFCHNGIYSTKTDVRIVALLNTLQKDIDFCREAGFIPRFSLFVNNNPTEECLNRIRGLFKDNGVGEYRIHTERLALGHQFGSLTGFYTSLKQGSEEFRVKNDDIFMFSHDDVYLYNFSTFKKGIHNFIDGGSDCWARRYIPQTSQPVLTYVMIESIVMSGGLVHHIVNNHTLPPEERHMERDYKNRVSVEMHVGGWISSYGSNKMVMEDITNNTYGENCMGFYHIPFRTGQGCE